MKKTAIISEATLTEECKLILQERVDDYWQAVRIARQFASNFDFPKIVDTFNAFDLKWGFADLVNKKYCSIFANYYVPDARFKYIVNHKTNPKNKHLMFQDDIKPYIIVGLINGSNRPYNICADYLKDHNIQLSDNSYINSLSDYINSLMRESRDATIDDVLANKNNN